MQPGCTHTSFQDAEILSQPSAASVSSLQTPPSGGTFSLSLQTYAAHTCFHSPSSPTLALICHSAWKGWFSPSVGPWCQSSLAYFFHPQTSFCCVYPILFPCALGNIYRPISSFSFKTLPKSNSPLWCLQNHGNHISDRNNFIISLHSCISYTFLALWLDGKYFGTMLEFHSVCEIPSTHGPVQACHLWSSLAQGLDDLEDLFQPKWFYNYISVISICVYFCRNIVYVL